MRETLEGLLRLEPWIKTFLRVGDGACNLFPVKKLSSRKTLRREEAGAELPAVLASCDLGAQIAFPLRRRGGVVPSRALLPADDVVGHL